MKEKIFDIIEVGNKSGKLSQIYDFAMLSGILLSIVPLLTKEENSLFSTIDLITGIIFLIDYLLRIYTADLKLNKGKNSFLIYPFTPMAVIDLVSILPTFIPLNSSLKVFRLFRIGKTMKTFKVFRVFKSLRYSKNISILIKVFEKQKDPLILVLFLSTSYIFLCAVIAFNIEPNTFNSFFDAIYWAVISLTSIGYGDIYLISTAGKTLTMISSIFGLAIIALPAGIITAGYIAELENQNQN